MTDEPQPQHQSGPPTEPQAAEGPGGAGAHEQSTPAPASPGSGDAELRRTGEKGEGQGPDRASAQAPGKGSGAAPGKDPGPAPETTQVLRRVDAGDGTGAKSPKAAKAAKAATSPKDAKAAKPGEETPAAESTQVLRRIKDTDAPSATPGAQAPAAETTHVLGRVKDASAAAGAAGGAAAAQASHAAQAAGLASPAAARAARAAAARGTRNTTGTPEHAPGQNPNANRNPNANANRNGNPADPAAPAGASGGGGGGKKPKRRKRTGWRRIIPTWRMVLGTFVIGVMLVIGLFFLGYSLVKIPTANALATKQSNVYLYADGSQLARDTRDSQVNRENVGLAEISKDAQHAVLAAEDRDFYTESAVDPKAMLRAGWNTATGKGKQSGSTITQQYVKNYYLGQEQTLTRKAKEFFIAIKLDREKSKDEILEGYLNTSYFGRGAYGIQAAAQAYYGKDAADLDPARAAYLAALVNAPSEYDVIAHPENKAAAVARWNYVLDGMVKKNWLSPSQRAGMKFPMPKEQTLSTNLSGQRGYLVDAVKNYLISNKIVTADELEAGGYRITTTFQKDKQNAFVKAVNDQLMSKLDKKNNQADKYVRAGGASVDPKTGQVVAMYGGIDYVKQYTNGATRQDFQVGSTFKPFVLASALQNGSTTQDGQTITPNTYYDGTNQRPVQGWSGGSYAPENEDQHSYGDITVRKATDLSVNAVYAQMAVDVGPDKVKQTAVDLGIPADTQDLYPSPSIALGTNTAGVLHMAEAYATLANHGRHGTYTMVKKVTKEGGVVQLPQQTDKQAVSREAADTTTNVLKSVVDNGTATAAQAVGRPAAGKTGTAEEDKAAWFAGYTPDLATVVSVMGQDPVTAQHKSLYNVMGVPRMNGGGPPTQIWAQYTRAALKNKPVTDFDLQLQPGAEQTAPPTSQPPAQPGTAGQDNGGTTGTPPTGGTPSAPTTGGTPPANGGATAGQGTTGGTTAGQGTTGGTTTGQGDAAGGTTQGNGGATGGPTTGGDTTGGNLPSGGNTDAGNDTAGGPPPTP